MQDRNEPVICANCFVWRQLEDVPGAQPGGALYDTRKPCRNGMTVPLGASCLGEPVDRLTGRVLPKSEQVAAYMTKEDEAFVDELATKYSCELLSQADDYLSLRKDYPVESIANLAYEFAEAMLARRNKGRGST